MKIERHAIVLAASLGVAASASTNEGTGNAVGSSWNPALGSASGVDAAAGLGDGWGSHGTGSGSADDYPVATEVPGGFGSAYGSGSAVGSSWDSALGSATGSAEHEHGSDGFGSAFGSSHGGADDYPADTEMPGGFGSATGIGSASDFDDHDHGSDGFGSAFGSSHGGAGDYPADTEMPGVGSGSGSGSGSGDHHHDNEMRCFALSEAECIVGWGLENCWVDYGRHHAKHPRHGRPFPPETDFDRDHNTHPVKPKPDKELEVGFGSQSEEKMDHFVEDRSKGKKKQRLRHGGKPNHEKHEAPDFAHDGPHKGHDDHVKRTGVCRPNFERPPHRFPGGHGTDENASPLDRFMDFITNEEGNLDGLKKSELKAILQFVKHVGAALLKTTAASGDEKLKSWVELLLVGADKGADAIFASAEKGEDQAILKQELAVALSDPSSGSQQMLDFRGTNAAPSLRVPSYVSGIAMVAGFFALRL